MSPVGYDWGEACVLLVLHYQRPGINQLTGFSLLETLNVWLAVRVVRMVGIGNHVFAIV